MDPVQTKLGNVNVNQTTVDNLVTGVAKGITCFLNVQVCTIFRKCIQNLVEAFNRWLFSQNSSIVDVLLIFIIRLWALHIYITKRNLQVCFQKLFQIPKISENLQEMYENFFRNTFKGIQFC